MEAKVRDFIEKCLVSNDEEQKICEAIVAAGARDGITQLNECYVDGMPLQQSLDVLSEIREVAMLYTGSDNTVFSSVSTI